LLQFNHIRTSRNLSKKEHFFSLLTQHDNQTEPSGMTENQTNSNLPLVKHLKIEFHCCDYELHTSLGIITRISNYIHRIGRMNTPAIKPHTIFSYFLCLSLQPNTWGDVREEKIKGDHVIIITDKPSTKHNNYQIGPISSQYITFHGCHNDWPGQDSCSGTRINPTIFNLHKGKFLHWRWTPPPRVKRVGELTSPNIVLELNERNGPCRNKAQPQKEIIFTLRKSGIDCRACDRNHIYSMAIWLLGQSNSSW